MDTVGDGTWSWRRTLPLAGLLAVGLAGWFGLRDLLSFEAVAANREAMLAWRDTHYALALLGYAAAHFAVVVFSFPGGFVMTVTGGFLFGLWPGAPLAVLIAASGATVVFVAARAGVGAPLRARLRARGTDGLFARIDRGLSRDAVSYLLLMRLVPLVPFPIANIAPAVFGVRLGTFFLTTLIGIAPGTAITAWIGVGMGEVVDRGETPGLDLLAAPQIALPLAGLAVLVAAPIVVRALGRRRRVRAADARR